MKHNLFFRTISQFSHSLVIIALLFSGLGISPAKAAPAGTALQFNGSSQYVTFGASQGPVAPGLGVQTFTIETWFKRTGTGATTSTSAAGGGGLLSAIPLVTKGRGEGDGADVDMNYWLGIDSATNVLVADFEECAPATAGCPAGGTAGLNHAVFGTAALQNNVWYHAAVTYDGQVWNLYLNGNLDRTLDIGANRFPRWDSRQHAGIGTAMTSTGLAAGFFAGVIDETRIWNVARSQADIQASMNSELTSGTGLIGRWGLNENTGTTANNSIAGRPNGTLTPAVTPPTWVAGFPIPDTTPPAAPTNLVASALGQTVNLTWTPNSDPDLAGYNVYRSTSPSVPLTVPINGATLVASSTYTDSGVSYGTPYYYVVTAVDSSNNQSAASNEVSVTPLASNGSALQFDGTNDYVTFGSASGLGVTSFTLEAWVKRDAGGTAMGTGTGGLGTGIFPLAYPVLTKGRGEGETPANLNTNYFLGIGTTGVIAADFEDTAGGANHPVIGVGTIPLGSWHHIAATYDGQTWRLYLDGVLDNASTLNSPFTPESTSIQHAALGSALLSTGLPGTSPGFFAGTIDEARVWNVARSQSAIQSTKNSEITSGTGLVARWGINEGSGATTNSSVGSFTGTLTNGPAWVLGFEPPAINLAPNAPTINAPADGATGIGTSQTLDVGVSDPNSGDPLTVTFFGRPYASGVFTQIAQNTGVASGSNTTTQWASLDAGQEFEWYVTVSDGAITTTGPTWTFHTTPSTDPVFVGTGDIASCSVTDDTATGEIISGIEGTIFTTGDNVYPNGTAADFTNCYATTPWGNASTLSRTRPVPGNHDWGTGVTNNLDGYFGYYGANATDAGGKSYYSYDIAGSNWHVVNLDSECQLVPGGCADGSPQETWLEADLAANIGKNVIALWHKPRYSSGATNYQTVQPLWDALYAAGVDILLVGHDHVYERLAPMKSGATLASPPVADPLYGIRQFTVGTGGEGHHGLGTALPTSEIRDDTTFGIFKLTLHATTYDWKFLPIAGSTFTDSGTGSVHAAPPEANQAPVAVADAYSTPLNTALIQSAPGVLANDTDANADPLTAVLVTDVSHGTLSLAANGGFTYTPTTGYTGADSFTYKANDGTVDSNTVTVSLTVTQTQTFATIPVSATTGEKPQSKVWEHAGTWWAVLPSTTVAPAGTWLWRLEPNDTWTNVLHLSNSTDTQADAKVVGDVTHLLLHSASSELVSIQYIGAGNTYEPWSLRPAASLVSLPGSETATIDIDSVGRMWLATENGANLNVYYSDAPYSTFTGPITLANNINGDDIGVVKALPNNSVGVLWSNQTTQRFGFRVHQDGTNPATWSTDEVPASQSALNIGLGMADDHLSVAVASDGTLYAAVKTSYDTAGATKIALLIRRPNGTWDPLYEVDQAGTRGIVLLNEQDDTVRVVYTSSEGFNDIVMKKSPTSAISFGPRTTLMTGGLNDATSQKANWTDEVLILASSASQARGAFLIADAGGGNQAPVAVADAYSTPQNTTLTAAAPGVLANDTDADADPLTAVLVTDVSHGALSLEADGSFTFTPTTGYSGPDSFTYKANDGTADSNTVTVSLTVTAPAATQVGWWQMENNAQDSSTYLNHGSLIGSPTFVTGRVGQAISLNGTSQYATVPDANSLDLTTGMTLATWIRPAVTVNTTQDLISKQRVTGTLVDGYGLSLSNAGKVFIRLNQATSGETYRINSTTNYPLNNTAWMHVAATYDGTTIKLYINGVLENSIAGPAAIATNNLPLTLGAQSDGSRFYNGLLDDPRVYATALSAAEIAALANPGPTNNAPVAVADSYSTAQDTALVQAAPGVLTNDTDADANPLTAVLVTNVSHGVLSLAANGGFTYTPTAAYSGPDSFTYKANDETIDSNTVTVSLTVTAPAATLVGSWQMENNAQDSSTYANHGSLVDSPAFVPGQIGQAISLNGTSQNISVPDSNSLDLTTAMTIAAWIKPGAAATQDIVKKATNGAVNGYELSLASPTSAAGQKVFVRFNQLASGDTYRVNSTTSYPADGTTWMHVAATYDGTTIKLYINGVLENSVAGPAAIATNSLPLTLGAQSDGTRFYGGLLDDVRIEARALSASEIAALAAAGANQVPLVNAGADQTVPLLDNVELSGSVSDDGLPFPPGTVTVTWSQVSGPGTVSFLDANSVSTTASFSANGTYVLRLTADDSALTASDDVTITIAPVVNNALDLGGTATDTYVSFGDPGKLDLAQFTIETWFKRTGTGVSNTTGSNGILNAIPLVTHGAPQADGSNVDANWILVIDDSTDVIAADFEDMATGLNHPVLGTTTITNNVWHHAAATYDGTTWRLYLDGNLEATLVVSASPRSDSIQRSGLGAMITSTGSALGRFQGTLDEARVWNRALTLAEIQANINSEVTTGSGLVARWGLNEGTGTSVGDSVPTSATGTVTGTNYTWVAGAPFNITINNPPNTPVLNSPANSATGVSTSPTLDAFVSDPDGDSLDVTFYGRPTSELPAPGPDFTIIPMPDTQHYTDNGGSNAANFSAQTQWIVANKDSRNIVFVTGLGDIVENGDTTDSEWQIADNAYSLIEDPLTTLLADGIPYGLAVGNHDQSPIGGGSTATTSKYNQYFGISRFEGRGYYGGHYGSDNDNNYELFSASGMDFIIIHFEWDTTPEQGVLDWADSLLTIYSDRRAILTTHWMINTGNPGSWGAQGQAIYNALSDHPNLFLMLGGHVPGEGRRQDTAVTGNVVNTLLSDYQSRANGGDGWLRIMTFSPANNTISVQTYSPVLGQFETDTDSQFTLTYDMQDGGAPFAPVGTTTVASGSKATVTWSGLTAGTLYEWYATVSDGNGTATSSTNTFTTADQTFTLNYTAGTGGTLTGDTSQTVNHGEDGTAVTALPNTGYHFVNWSDSSTANPRTDTNATANVSVTANFAINTFSLNYTAGVGGTLTGNTSQTVNYGADGTSVTAVPNTGYHFIDWSDGVLTATRTDTNVTSNLSVAANFALDTFTLSYAAGTGGSLTGNASQTVNYGENGTVVSAVPNLGYHFVDWSDGILTATRTDTNVMANVDVTANFAVDTFTLNYAAETGGTLTGVTSQIVNYGEDGTPVTAEPNAGYHFVNWSDGVLTATRTDTSVTANLSVTANFAIDTFTLNYAPGTGGTLTGETSQTVNYGANGTEVTAVPNTGDHFVNWSDGSTVNPRADTHVTADISVTANFAINTFTLNYVSGTGGTLNGDTPQTVNYGGSGTPVTAVPDTGYHFVDWSDSSTDNPRTDTDVTADVNVTANFAQNTFTLDVTVVGSGTVIKNPDQATYPSDSTVELTATTAPGWTFAGWSGDASGSSNPLDVTMDGDKSIIATFTQNTYALDVTVVGNGTVTRDNDGPYHFNDEVILTATPASGWTFSGWSGHASGSANQVTVTIDGDKSVTATFVQSEYTLTVNTTGNGTVTRSADGPYHLNDQVTLTAVPATGWTFSGWSGSGCSGTGTCIVTMDDHKTVNALFTPIEYALTVNITGNGSVARNADQATYHYGDIVELTAAADSGWTFDSWGGALSGNTNPQYVTVNGDTTVSATFTQNAYTLDVTIVGTGTVSKSPDQPNYFSGSVVQLMASAAPGWMFSGWRGDASGNTNPLNVTMNGNKSITATFTEITYTLDVTIVGNGTVSKNPDQAAYSSGSTVELTAAAAPGWQFSGWSGNASGTANPLNVTINGNTSITATFTAIPPTCYVLTLSHTGQGSDPAATPTNSAGCSTGQYVAGASINLSGAVPTTGWQITGWTGTNNNSSTASTNSVTMPASAHSASVSYTQIEYSLTVNIVGSGSVAKSPNQTTYHYGDIVQLTATPSSGWIFTSWSGDASGSTNPINVTMNGNKTVTATFTQNDLIFADGFSACNATSWSSTVGSGLTFPASAAYNSNCGMAVAITTNNPTYVRDNTPNLETRYRARFYFNTNGMSMGKNNAHFIFGGYSATNSNMLVVELRRTGSSLQIRAGLLNDRNKWSYTAWSTISSGWNAIEFDWRAATAAGTNNGGLTLWLNGTQVANLTGVDNDLQKVDWIALGAVSNIDSATRGTYYFDAFESRRQNYIGP